MLGNNIKETTTTTGTGTITLTGAFDSTFLTLGSQFADGEPVEYTIEDGGTGDLESGIGIYNTAGPTLTRPSASLMSTYDVSADTASAPKGTPLSLTGTSNVSVTPAAQNSLGGLNNFDWGSITDANDICYPHNVVDLAGGHGKASNIPHFFPSVILRPTIISQIGMNITTLDASTTDNRVAIYGSLPSGMPGHLIIASGHISGAATGEIFENVTDFLLPAGFYFFAQKNDGSTLKLAGPSSTNYWTPMGASKGDTTIISLRAAAIVGAWPDPAPTTGWTAESAAFPLMGFTS